jgi:lipopolysaccharide biosynthesis glycosyltransferase
VTEVVDIVVAADNNFAMPLAVTVMSVIARLKSGIRLRVHILDMGIKANNRAKINTVADKPGVEVNWIGTLGEKVSELPNTWLNITRATYARLFIPDVLPPDVSRVLYLDCDLIARRSVHELFDVDMEGKAVLGVADGESPFVGSRYGVPWWLKSGRNPGGPNLNAGVLLMDLDVWRRDNVGPACLEYLTDGRHELAQDQEALNSVVGDQLGLLDPRWNVQAEVFQREFEMTLPYDTSTLAEMKSDPWIVHFTNARKPWIHGCKNPFTAEWTAMLDQTPYQGMRPTLAKYVWKRGRRVPRWAWRQLRAAKS